MRSIQRWIAVTAATAMLFTASSQDLHAQSGNAYYDGQNATTISPEWAFGGLLALSLIVIALQNSNGGHGHSGSATHSHSH